MKFNYSKYYWDLNKKALGETKKILTDPKHPKFITRMVTLFSRCQNPQEVFSLISKEEFVEVWPKLRSYWAKIVRESEFRNWWETVYEELLEKLKHKERKPSGIALNTFIKIGKIIKKSRTRKGLSQKDLALRIGMKQPDISKIEEGRKNVTLKTLVYLSKALNIKTIEL